MTPRCSTQTSSSRNRWGKNPLFIITTFSLSPKLPKKCKGISFQEEDSNDINRESPDTADKVELGDLEVIATLGVGGFGRVELVKVIMIMIVPRMTTIDQCRDRQPSLVFALKVMSKQHLLETLQQEHVFSEREVMAACSHQFITRCRHK